MARTKRKASGGIGKQVGAEVQYEYQGICSTCNYAPDCAHRIRNPGLAIWECENYDDYVPLSGKQINGGLSEVVPAPRKSLRPEFDAVEYQGLCKNCERRDDCTFPRPAGGVWHCEEYE
ncbi:MAG: hypothetical protein GTN49_03595 [candidate division Zixibacteria bacterium]|nr:hypothetical protein [candidate division Zixibacteria bacterium]